MFLFVRIILTLAYGAALIGVKLKQSARLCVAA